MILCWNLSVSPRFINVFLILLAPWQFSFHSGSLRLSAVKFVFLVLLAFSAPWRFSSHSASLRLSAVQFVFLVLLAFLAPWWFKTGLSTSS